MSNVLYDFLVDSPLFNATYIEEGYSKLSDNEIKRVFIDYREYVLSNKTSLFNEIKARPEELMIQTEAYDNYLPKMNLLKQMALYMDKVIINDPIFAMTNIDKEASKVMNSYLGFNSDDSIDRKALIEKVKYMKRVTDMVTGQYVKFIPMSYVHEPPKYPNLYYSENYFSDVLPENIMEWFHQRIKVHNLSRSSQGWQCNYAEQLRPGRSIIIDFEGHNYRNSNIYFLFETQMLEYDDKTKLATFVQTLPDTLPDKHYFEAWVCQSINRAAENFYNQVFSELYNTSLIGSSYLTTSPFVAELLNLNLSRKNNFESEIANLVLNLDLPVIQNSSVEKIMYLRNSDGEIFKNFRVELRKQLRGLRQISDPTSLKFALENVTHEISEVQVNEVNKKFNQVKKSLFADVGMFSASLATTFQTGGMGLIGCAAAIAKGYKDYTTYATKVKENPGYFLWKLKR